MNLIPNIGPGPPQVKSKPAQRPPSGDGGTADEGTSVIQIRNDKQNIDFHRPSLFRSHRTGTIGNCIFGRGIDEAIDRVLVIVEPSFDSLQTAAKIKTMATAMSKKVAAIMNKSPSAELSQKIKAQLVMADINVIGDLPQDPTVFEACLSGRIPDQGEALEAADQVLQRVLTF